VSDKVYDGDNSADILTRTLNDIIPEDVVTVNEDGVAIFDTKNVGVGKNVTATYITITGDDSVNYSYDGTATGTGTITQRPLTVTATGIDKIYDALTDATVTLLDDRVAGDSLTVTYATAAFADKNVDTGKTVTVGGIAISDGDSGNYTLTNITTDTTADITPKELTATITVSDKVYDGNTNATITDRSSNKIGADAVTLTGGTANFDTKNAGTGKVVTADGIAIAGADSGNYSYNNTATGTGNITQKPLTVTATGNNREYDATPNATVNFFSDGIIGDDDVTFVGTATFADKNFGDDKPISVVGITKSGLDAGNYTLTNITTDTTADITPKELTATITVSDKVYDGNTSAIITDRYSSAFNGDTIVLSGGTATFEDENIGNDKLVEATGINIDGADAGNYSYDGTATGTGNILPIPTIVYVDDDFTTEGSGEYTFGYNAFNTIQAGITAVDVDGTVNVEAGTYAENITINKTLTLQGIVSTTIINAGSGPAITIVSDGVTVDGFRITHSVAEHEEDLGILLNQADNNVIENNNIYGNSVGVEILDSASNTIEANTLNQNMVGLYFEGTTDGVNFDGGSNGPFYSLSLNNIITGNTITNSIQITSNSGVGIYLDAACENNTFTSNIVTGNQADGIYTWKASNNTYISNTIQNNGGSGFQLMGSSGNTITGNTVNSNATYGFLIRSGALSSTNNTITGNTIDGNTTAGILLEDDADGNNYVGIVSGNTINSNKIIGTNGVITASSPVGITYDLEKNWWGTTVATEIVTKVSSNVDYRPWCGEEACVDDSVSPGVAISSLTTSPTKETLIPVTITFTESVSDFTTEEIIVSNGTKSSFSGSGSIYTVNVAPIGDGEITVNVSADVAWDLSGNYNTAATQFSITYDSVNPTATVEYSPADSTNQDVVATITPDETVTVTSAGGLTHTFIENGSFTFTFVDDAGNEGSVEATVSNIDKVAPEVAITSPSADLRVNGADIIIFTDTETTSPQCSIDDTQWVDCESSTTTLVDVAGFSSLVDGIFTLYLRDTDLVGNTGDTSVDLFKDTSIPTVTAKSPSVNAVGIDPNSNITVTFSENVNITSAKVTVKKGETEVATVVTFDSETNVATIDPSVTLDNNSTYEVTLLATIEDVAGNALIETKWSFTTSASYAIHLTKGWNLISLPVVPNNTAIGTVLGDTANSIESVWTYDALSDTWMVYHPSESGTSTLTNMTAGYGYWVNYSSDTPTNLIGAGNLIQEGNSTPPSRRLKEGWNLIGYYQKPNSTSSTADNALHNNLDIYWTILLGYDNTNKQITTLVGNNSLNPGEGFWVWLNADKAYTMGQ
jgi:parallel beta-helix repeat protein